MEGAASQPLPEGPAYLSPRAPWVPRWDLGFQPLMPNGAWDADACPAGEARLPKRPPTCPGMGTEELQPYAGIP